MKRISPLLLYPSYYEPIEAEIQRIFNEAIFEPLSRVLGLNSIRPLQVTNARDALIDAILSGRVWFDGNSIKGKFSSTISKRLIDIGAKYNHRSGTWTFKDTLLPAEVSMALAQSAMREADLVDRLYSALDRINASVDAVPRLTVEYGKVLDKMDAQYAKTINPIAIPVRLSPYQREAISLAWAKNLNTYIQDWIAEDVLDLRSKIQKRVLSGARAESMEAMIQANYGVSKRKAKFLARQETSLLMSKFRETRYTELGLLKYQWSGVMDERERPDHKLLEDKIFNWDDPPIVDRKTGRRGHPGEDYNCRCIAIPVFE